MPANKFRVTNGDTEQKFPSESRAYAYITETLVPTYRSGEPKLIAIDVLERGKWMPFERLNRETGQETTVSAIEDGQV